MIKVSTETEDISQAQDSCAHGRESLLWPLTKLFMRTNKVLRLDIWECALRSPEMAGWISLTVSTHHMWRTEPVPFGSWDAKASHVTLITSQFNPLWNWCNWKSKSNKVMTEFASNDAGQLGSASVELTPLDLLAPPEVKLLSNNRTPDLKSLGPSSDRLELLRTCSSNSKHEEQSSMARHYWRFFCH